MADTQAGSETPGPAPGAFLGSRRLTAVGTVAALVLLVSHVFSTPLLRAFPAWTFSVGGMILVRRRRLRARQEQTP